MKTKRFLALLLSVVMVLGMLPAVTLHAHAVEHVNGVTLTSSIGKVTPAAVLDNVVVYDIWTAENYTLTTTPDNTYGVFFRTYYSREWIVDEWYEEGGYYETDDLAEITLDNVTIRTQNPRHAETAGDAVNRYGALTFWAAEMEWNDKNQQGKEYMGVIVDVKGTNTVELLGVENDTADAKWSAVSFVNCYGNFYGRGSNATLNATIAYDNAVGEAAALRGTSSINFGDAYNEYDDETPVTINVVAQVTGADGTTKHGNGIDIIDYSLNCAGDTNLNIVANDTGILRRYEKYANWMQFTDSTVAVAAGKAAIINEGVNDDHKLCAVRFENCTVEMGGIYVGSELVDPLDSGINAAGYIDFCKTTATVTAVNIALNSAYDLGGSQSYNHDSYVQIRDDSDVTVTGSMGEQEDAFSSKIAAIDTEAYYAAVYVKMGSKLTVNAGWLAIKTLSVQPGADCELWVNTVYPSDDGALSCSQLIAFGASTSDENSKPAKVRIDSAAARLGVGQSCEFDSNDVLIHTAGGAPISPLQGSHTIYLEEGILVMESVDGENWQPVSADRNSLDTMRWLTTIPQSSHICANDDKSAWVKVEDADQHTAPCLVCGETLTRDCEYVYYNYYPTPTATTDGEISYKCEVGSKNHYKDIIVPAHNCADYVNKWEDYGSATKHEGACTYFVEAAGIPCGNEVYVDHTFTEWSGDSLTISRTCTGCGYVESKSTHENVTHMEAIAGDCSKPGRIEFWHCTDSDCGLYFSDALMTQVVAPEDTFTTPGAHNYGADGVCTVCGDKKTTVTFVQFEDDSYSSDMDGELFILVGFKDGKAYVMGNKTNDDGSRNAVEIPVKANGAIDADSATAEFFAFDFDEGTLSPDGGYMSMLDGKIVVYDKGRVDEDGLPKPIIFSQNSSYSDETGYLLNWTNDWCIVFDADTLSFKVSDTPVDSIIRYKQVCPHENLWYTPAAEATCTEQGAVEYWYCGDCYGYFMNHDFEKPVEIDNESELTKKATGHKFDADDICENCGMKRHVYKPVTSLEQFDNLSEDASYIIVFKDLEELATVPDVGGGEGGDAIPSSESGVEEVIPGEDDGSGDTPPPGGSGTDIAPDAEFSGKTYAAYYPDVNAFDQMVSADSDGDGLVDLLEPDVNANGIPDIVEEYIDTQCGGADENGDGTTTADEYKQTIGSCDEDEDVDIEDYKLFFSYNVENWLYDEFWEENAINHLNIVEVTVASDGSITITDEGVMEFQMMVSGVWGSQPPLEDDYKYDYEYFGIQDTERMRAAWIPNYWIGASGMMGYYGEEYFSLGERYYGDGEYPGIIDHKNWKISFREDGTACLVNSWTDLEDTGALQLAKYTDSDGNTRLTIVGIPEWQWEYSDIMMNCTALLPAYLYASEPVYNEPPHTCEWGPWEDDDVTDTHTRECTVEGCDKKQTENHNWDKGVETKAPTCTENGTTTYTCPDCKATKTEPIPALDHDWGEWTYDSVDSHIRNCKRNCGVEQEMGGHEWGDWTPVDDTTHKMVCDLCKGEQTGEHSWDNGVITKEPTEWEEGFKTYTCGDCSHTKTEPVDKLVHECTWTDWYPNGDENHKRDCMDDNCDKFETLPHEWDDGVITKEPTCKEAGVKTFTCLTCQHTRTEDVPTTDHVFGNWTPNNDGKTHSRYCSCNESETADHKFDDGEVTQAPTHEAMGERKYTCSDCGYFYTEDIPTLTDHEWGDWVINKLDEANTHIRYCICNESQTAPHNFDDGVITEPATHTSKGIKTFTCTDDCGYSYDEEIPPTPDHEWTDWSPNGDGTHTRACRCNANETKDCEWDDGVITKQPTHFEEGIKTFTCTVCGGEKTEPIAKTTGHEWTEWTPDNDGKTHTRLCKCGASETKDHSFDEGKVTEPATHTSKGVKTYTCGDCGYSYDEEILPTPAHEWTDWSPNGDGTHTRACRCNANETKDCEWGDGVITKQPTHYEEGVKTFTCTVCKATKTEPIAKITAHEWGDWAKKDDKSHIRECKCGATETKDHAFDAGTVTKEPTHLETGVKKFTCVDCRFVREDVLDKIPEHTFGKWKTEATVVGKHYRECACGEREIGDCTWDAGVVTTEPTYEATGAKTYTCTVCGGTKTETIDMLVKADEIVSPENSDIKITTPEGSNAVLNENTVLKVEEVKDEVSEDVKANVEIVVGNDNAEVLASYDISLILDGATVQPGGTVEVTLPAPENAADFDTLQVVYIDDDGNVTPCETRVNADGTVTFVTDHFSHYAIVGVQNSSPLVWILISAISVVLIAGAVVAVLVIKKKKGIA